MTVEEEVSSLSSLLWLNNHICRVSFSDDNRRLKVYLHDEEAIAFMVDKRMKFLLEKYKTEVLSIYQYSISCGELSESFGVILQRLNLSDCYTLPYEVYLLKGFSSEIEVQPINGHSRFLEDDISSTTFENIDEMINFTHREVSLKEAISLFDPFIHRTSSSSSTEFVNTVRDRNVCYLKVKDESPTSFKVDGSAGNFERVRSNIDKYFDRKKAGHVTLAEFCSYYNYLGSNKSEEMFKLLNREDIEIKPSEIPSAFSKDEFLPEFILTHHGEVLKIRSVPKLLAYPCYEDNEAKFCYMKVLLFFPLREDPENDEDVFSLYRRCDGRDGNGANETIVQRNLDICT